MTIRAASSWSGGKDSCLAWLRAADQGLQVEILVTMVDPGGLSKSHALPPELLTAQADVMNAKLLLVEAGISDYGAVFASTLRSLRDGGTTHMIFGDIDLQAHRDWLEPICRAAGIDAVFPLWGMARRDVADEIIDRNIKATIVCVDTRWLDESHCGVSYDRAFLARLPDGVCPCGENGEFHTFVWDAPRFARPLHCGSGPLRRMRTAPPFASTELLFQTPICMT